jgi:hypothetical protein
LYRFVGKVKVRAGGVSALVGRSLKQSNREPGIIFQKEIACGNAKKIHLMKGSKPLLNEEIGGNAPRLPGNQSILPR